MTDGKKETVSITKFNKWPFANDFRIEAKGGKVLSALCKYLQGLEKLKVLPYNRFVLFFFQESVTYIFWSTFAPYVGTWTSFHHWCKEKIRGNSISDEQPHSSFPILAKNEEMKILLRILNNTIECFSTLN